MANCKAQSNLAGNGAGAPRGGFGESSGERCCWYWQRALVSAGLTILPNEPGAPAHDPAPVTEAGPDDVSHAVRLLFQPVHADNAAVTEPFEFFEHTADIGVRVTGATLPELFVNAARAMYAALGKLETTGREQRRVELQAETVEDLLHDWLAELLVEVETRQILYDKFTVTVQSSRLEAELSGGTIDWGRSHPKEEIKAVTYHRLRVEQTPAGLWQATVIFDV